MTLRFLDRIDPTLIHEMDAVAMRVPEVLGVKNVRARWLGHLVNAEITIAVDRKLPIQDGQVIAEAVRQTLVDRLNYLNNPSNTSNIVVVVESG